MLYIFHVDTGTMMTFDMNLAMENVSALQTVIAKACHISEDKQVLLISGGESLDPAARVCKYSAGTDTNPIYLFSKSTIEAATPPSPSVHYGSDVDLHSQVEGSLIMPPAYETVVSRAQLALQFQDVDQDELRACQRLVHDQHLQQQGWAAVVANLEDISSALQCRSEIFQEAYKNYMEHREDFLLTLMSINDSLQLLTKIPLLPCLHIDATESNFASSTSLSSEQVQTAINSLFDWINSQDPHHSLQDMVDQCKKVIDQFDDQVLSSILTDVEQTFEAVSNQNMKEVKGLEDRLYGLDQIMSGAQRLVTEQKDMAQGFVQNQTRLSDLRDNTLLPDLCASHRKQLLVMLNNHKKLREIKRKCRLAKEDLSVNLHTRLRWVMFVEKKICAVDGKLMIYHENLRRLRKRLDILQQIHSAPKVYAMLVVEVVRRRRFSSKYLQWATSIASESSQIHKDEVRRRQEFVINVGQHFLQSLFHGFEDFSVTFAAEPPSQFDQSLPQITQDDVEMLRSKVPELEDVLRIPVEEVSKWTDLPTGESFQINLGLDFSSHNIRVSATTSDIDIIQSCGEVLSGEASLNLGQQVAECQSESGILIQSNLCSGSLSEKTEFLMPRSLSETLTKEMRDQTKRQSGEFEDVNSETVEEDDNFKSLPAESVVPVLKQTECCHSTGSDTSPPSVLCNESLSSGKKMAPMGPVSASSPEMETSQEFTTADFYFDESMPSSIADSPPNKPVTEEKKSAATLLQEKATLIEKYQKELQDYQVKLSSADRKLKTLQELLGKTFPELQENIKCTGKLLDNQRKDFLSNIENTKQSLLQTLLTFQSSLSTSNEENIDRMKCEYEHTQKNLEDKFDLAKAEISQLEKENHQIQEKMGEIVKEYETNKLDFNSQKTDLEMHYKTDMEQMIKEHSLELEVEMDRVRSEFKTHIDSQEEDLKNKDDKITALEEKLEQNEKEHLQMEEDLTQRYQQEKEELHTILELDYNEQLKAALSKEQDTLKEYYHCQLEEIKRESESVLVQKLDELRSSSESEKQKAIENIQQKMDSKYECIVAELKLDLSNEKEECLKLLEKKIKCEHSEELNKCIAEFASEKETLMSELKTFTDKKFCEHESQTDPLPETLLKEEHDEVVQNLKDEFRLNTENLEERLKVYTERVFSSVEIQTEELPQSLLQEEHDAVLKTMEEQFTAKEESLLNELHKFTCRECLCCEVQTDDLPLSLPQVQHDAAIRDLHKMFDEEKEQLKNELKKKQNSECVSCNVQTDQLPETILKIEHEQTLNKLHADCDQVTTQFELQLKKLELDHVSNQEHLSKETESKYQNQKEEEIQKALEIQKAEHEKMIDALIAKLEKDKEDSCSSIRTSFMAEKQVVFNEALARVVQEKEQLIDELKQKQAEMKLVSQEAKESLEKLNEVTSKLTAEKQQVENTAADNQKKAIATKRMLEDELAMMKQQLTLYQQQIQDMSSLQKSTTYATIDVSTSEESGIQYRIMELESEVRNKNQEIGRLSERVMELSMTTSTRSMIQDKVSITSCNIGDLILLCLDERHDHYIVFTIGTTLHFLHSDCLEILGLKTNPGESRKSWVLAEIIDKEYCQAKKPQNRFKVPVGTKFYRVKAKPWVQKLDTAARGK